MKKSLVAVLAGSALVAAAAGANAANYVEPATAIDINIYGASAQFGFWNAAAGDFVMETTANGGLGCASKLFGIDSGGKTFGIVVGRTCSAVSNKDVVIRYSSKASYDGIYAVKGSSDTDSCGSNFQRKMADESALDASIGTSQTISSTKCVVVTLGASDVAGESFTQSSAGQTSWSDTTPYKINGSDPSFSGISTSGLTDHQSLVVPFAFYVNKKVTVGTCTAGTKNQGGQCRTAYAVTDCGTGGVCTVATLDNMSRLMAVQIFSGTAAVWQDFGAGFANLPIVACYRHAGSGTHATLDKSVMHSTLWGGSPQASETIPASTDADFGQIFNVDTSAELGCVGHYDGGVGYADADNLSTTAYSRIKYNGVAPMRTNLRNGLYDTFYSFQHLFEDTSRTTADQQAIRVKMLNYVKLHSLPSSKADYWATAAEMVWAKKKDANYPEYITGGTVLP